MNQITRLELERTLSPTLLQAGAQRRFCIEVARMAALSLYDELSLYPKPGLVSLVDNGSHSDMDAATFMRSLFSLRHFFFHITAAGIAGAPFIELKQLGIAAEARMLVATRGINTHRGAIFCVGLLCATAGRCYALGLPLAANALRSILLKQWGQELVAHAAANGFSHGLKVATLYAVSGAREEAALGMPSVFELAWPTLQRVYAKSSCWQRARLEALFALMAHISDTNVYYRGGASGALIVKILAKRFLERGGSSCADWWRYAVHCHRLFTLYGLSPGGAADLLAAACLLQRLTMSSDAGTRS